HSVTGEDERGVRVTVALDIEKDKARKPADFRTYFEKLGNTCYYLRNFDCKLSKETFIKASDLTALRRSLIEKMERANRSTYKYDYRLKEDSNALYPDKRLTYMDNVSNTPARSFYESHGVTSIEPAMETGNTEKTERLMTTRHCILRERDMCLKRNKGAKIKLPLTIESSGMSFRLFFDCVRCEMHLLRR
ncbi:MAG: DUF3656 domain-containing protein, partial [Muribaculaceae bacterium]|nr:DUF3656 domain-containing protein [Muribaculaceae bacterium]